MTIIKATKKPVTIEAVLWDGSERSTKECLLFMGTKVSNSLGDINLDRFTYYCHHVVEKGLPLKPLESGDGHQIASVGDYIIKGVQGEYYPCKPDVFELTYDF